ncbi:hypothetical protein ACLOJK_041428 [Asimina triloba]
MRYESAKDSFMIELEEALDSADRETLAAIKERFRQEREKLSQSKDKVKHDLVIDPTIPHSSNPDKESESIQGGQLVKMKMTEEVPLTEEVDLKTIVAIGLPAEALNTMLGVAKHMDKVLGKRPISPIQEDATLAPSTSVVIEQVQAAKPSVKSIEAQVQLTEQATP